MRDIRIIAFFCQWCSYRGADLAGVSRLSYPSNIRIIKIPCTGGLSPHLVLKALQGGADGILIGGCYPGECHYEHGNLLAEKRLKVLKKILEIIGISGDRIEIEWISAGEGLKVQRRTSEFFERIKKLGPSPIRRDGR
jgi:coenzyme F420-reducing hydrogenase delta subunit